MATRLTQVVFDALDWEGLAGFWAEVLGWRLAEEYLGHGEADLVAPDGSLELVFVPTSRPKTTKNRLHLDVAPGPDQAATVGRLLDLGARPTDIGQAEVAWVVLADPEGNEFCVLREPSAEIGLASICLDAAAPAVQGPFWAAACGWVVERQSANLVGLRSPDGSGPGLVMGPAVAPKHGKNRLHIDVAPHPEDDLGAEVERLVRAGARAMDIGQGFVPWVVLTDPEDNEFCVLTPR